MGNKESDKNVITECKERTSLAGQYLEETIKNGNTVEIPSLGIKIVQEKPPQINCIPNATR